MRRNLNNINTELQDVQRIMVQNIDDVLQRGEALGGKICVQQSKYNTVSIEENKHYREKFWVI